MKIADVRKNAYAMPLTSPAFPPGPYRFIDREYLIITYRTDKAALEAVVPEPLTFDEPIVKYEFIRMPNSTGFGDYTKLGKVIPVRYNGVEGGYTHAMFLNDGPPIYGGGELWAFRRNMRNPRSGPTRIPSSARSTMEQCALRPARWDTSIRPPT